MTYEGAENFKKFMCTMLCSFQVLLVELEQRGEQVFRDNRDRAGFPVYLEVLGKQVKQVQLVQLDLLVLLVSLCTVNFEKYFTKAFSVRFLSERC